MVTGYVASLPYRAKAAYETSIQTSIYLAPAAVGRGIGSVLYRALFAAIAGEDLHRAYAGITMPNDASVALHERFGFRAMGYSTQVGRKFGRYWDVALYEKPL
jgi:phosphinothricin acetyltransferase